MENEYKNIPTMDTFFKRCRFSTQSNNENYYCYCPTSEHLSRKVNCDDDSKCSNCSDFHSCDDLENFSNDDDFTESLDYE